MKMTSNHGLHLSFRWASDLLSRVALPLSSLIIKHWNVSWNRMVMFSNNVEPANGFLLRYLHRKAVEAYQNEEMNSAQCRALLHVLDWIPQLWYHLHAFLEKHSTSDFLIGKRQRKRWRLNGWWSVDEQTCPLPQAPASSCRVLFQWQSSGSGSSTSGTTPSYHTYRRELKTASRWALKTSSVWQQNKNRKLLKRISVLLGPRS